MPNKTNDSFYKETPVGNLYGGYFRNYPLVRGGDNSTAWLGLNDYQLRANKFDFPDQTSQYAVGLNFPDSVNIPDYYGEMNTPFGKIFGGTNDGNPNINVGFQPNDRTQAYIAALSKILGL